ncbi:PAS domain S-box protein [Rhodopirellula halodulae]|uniref:PAS domain S-box protein n=1 Tax=Rhodopirellula halodulae TaxID=2894198 RepID=UPI001E62C10F|nr:PAS domain S-box protein [Rhodopirellula sp. JC737]MCC9654998.1 PAS domain S-box protein [Rhodopirellula sp. JC737]
MADHQSVDRISDPNRLNSLRATKLLDSPPDAAFDRLTRLASRLLKCPASVVTLVDEDRQFFKSCIGLPEPWASRRESPLTYSFCRQAVLCDEPFIVDDASIDPRVKDNPAVAEFGVKAYAGIPIRTTDGHVLGSLCVFDAVSREWNQTEIETLSELASSVESEIELVTISERERDQQQLLAAVIEQSPLAVCVVDSNARVQLWNRSAERMFGYRSDEVVGEALPIVPPKKQSECQTVRESVARGESTIGLSTDRMRRDGTLVHVKLAAVPLAGYEGEPGRMLLMFDDISEQIRADAERDELLGRLQEETSLTNAVLDQLPAGVIVADAESRKVLSINEQAHELIGRRVSAGGSADALASSVGYHVDGTRYQPEEWPTERTMRRGESISNEDIVFEHEDGTRRRILTSSKLVTDANGKQARAITTFTDVTKIRELEAARYRSEQQAKQILASSHDSIKILDLQGCLVSLNPVGALLHEIDDVDELIGTPWIEFWEGEDRERAATAVAEALAGRSGRFRGIRPTRLTKIDRWWDVVVTPIRGENGEPEQILAISRDITESVRAEQQREGLVQKQIQARQEAESAREKYQNLVNGLDAIVWEADANTWEFSFVSERAEQILGYPIQRWLADPGFWPSIIHPDDRQHSIALCQNATRQCQDHDFEYRAITRDGRTVWLRDIVYVTSDDEGHPSHLRGVMVDISARKELEQELRQRAEQLAEMDARKNEFLAVLAHELRNPLAPVSNAAELLPLCKENPQEVMEIAEILQAQSSQLVRLIDDLMDLSRITRGKIQLQKESVSMVDILQTSVSSVRPSCLARGHQLNVDLSPGNGVVVMGDRVRLAQVFTNLLNNACKYTPSGGAIDVGCEVSDGFVEVFVADNGVGISPEDAEGIFEMFTQVESSVTRSQGGLGIGLTLVQQLVGLHDGVVVLDQTYEGPGSRFVVRLPISNQTEISDEQLTCVPSETTLNVVVIDDVRAVATMLVKLIGALGHQAQMALGAEEGIELVHKIKPDVVFSDICMPGHSGYEVAAALLPLKKSSGTTLIAMTGNGQPEDVKNASAAGFDHHLVKPASIQMLRRVFEEIIATKSSAR